MIGARSWLGSWLVWGLLQACGSEHDPEQDLPDERLEDAGPDSGEDVDGGAPDADARRCVETYGRIEVPANDTVTHTVGGTWPDISAARISTIARGRPVYLAARADRVQGTTSDGRTIDCRGSYVCEDPDVVSVTAFIGEQQWTSPGLCSPWGDPSDIRVSDIAKCVERDKVVIEGRLQNYDPARAPSAEVVLVGSNPIPWEVIEFTAPEYPARACEVSGDRYRCTTLGYRDSFDHKLRVKVGSWTIDSESFTLEVDDCRVETRAFDFDACPDAARPLIVFAHSNNSEPLSVQVSASFEGGPPIPCTPRSDARTNTFATFLCPAGTNGARGAGRYELTASGLGHDVRAEYQRTFDGCSLSDGPVSMDLNPSESVTPSP